MSEQVTQASEAPSEAPIVDAVSAEAEAFDAALAAMDGGDADSGGPQPGESAEGGQKATPKKEAKQEAKDGGESDEPKEGPDERTWKAIARREEAVRKQAQEAKEALEQSSKLQEQYETLQSEVSSLGVSIREDPIGFIQKYAGVTFDDLARQVVSGGQKAPVQQKPGEEQKAGPSKELEELRATIQQMQNQKLIDDYRGEIRQIGHEEYPLLAKTGRSEQLILARAQQYARDGEYMTPAEIAQRIEGEMAEELKGYLTHEAVLKKLGLSPSAEAGRISGASESPQGRATSPKTLSNSHSAAPSTSSQRRPEEMSEDELIAEALRAMPQ